MDELLSRMSAYNGDAPYIFVSYCHKDAKSVLPAIAAMQERGFRIWFDLGIEAGTEWANNIAAHLRDCAAFVAFVSNKSVQSENCLDEIAYAKSHKKPSLLIFLEDGVVLPEGTEMQTARFQRMLYFRQASIDRFADQLRDAPLLSQCRSEVVASTKTTATEPIHKSTAATHSSNRLPLIVGAIAAALVIAILLIVLISGGDEKPSATPTESTTEQAAQESTDAPTETEASTEEGLPQPSELSDDLNDYTFKLGGIVMQLPCSFDTLASNGWTIASSSCNSQSLIAGLSTYEFDMMKDGSRISIGVLNPSGNATPVSECLVCEIFIYRKDAQQFEIASGITLESDEETIISTFGMPIERTDNTDSTSLRYYDGDYSVSSTVFYLDSASTGYSYIKLRNRIDPMNTKTETNATEPEFLKEYQAPTELGSDPTSGIVQFEGDLYMLPAPINELMKNGWTMSTNPGGVPAGGSASITLTRDGKSVDLTVNNFAEYQTTIENCVVTEFRLSHYDWEETLPVDLLLPGGLKLGITTAEAAIIAPDKLEHSDNNFSYYESTPRDFELYFSFNEEIDTLNYLKIECTTWHYGAQ